MNIFSLTETEFFQKLTEGKNDNLHIAYKDFVLQVSELCNKEPHKGCVISALLFVEVEISHLQTAAQRKRSMTPSCHSSTKPCALCVRPYPTTRK